MTEQAALERLKQQDPTGLEMLMCTYGALVQFIIRQILGPEMPGDIEECATDVWVSVWQKASQYDAGRSSFKTWISMLARHRAIDQLRKRYDPTRSAISLDDERLAPICEEMQEFTEILEEQEERQKRSIFINQAIARMPEADRNLIIRRYYYFEEITDLAKEAGVSRSVVDNRLSRSRKLLRALYLEVSRDGR